eukprot:3851367-Rhodomonas_salina.2
MLTSSQSVALVARLTGLPAGRASAERTAGAGAVSYLYGSTTARTAATADSDWRCEVLCLDSEQCLQEDSGSDCRWARGRQR